MLKLSISAIWVPNLKFYQHQFVEKEEGPVNLTPFKSAIAYR
jgi:hypothetical protein